MADKRAAVERLLTNPAYTLALSRTCLRLAGGTVLLAVLLTGKLFVDELRPERRTYFASNPFNEPYAMVPLDRPVVTEASMLAFTVEAVATAYSMDFLNYRADSQRARAFFEPHAFNTWAASFKAHGNLDKMIKGQMAAAISPSEAAVVRAAAVINGRMTWEVQFEAVVTFANSNGPVREHRLIKATVRRSDDPAHHPKGIAIAQLSDPPLVGSPGQRTAAR